MKVLIVDDSEELLLLLNSVLQRLGCDPYCCTGITQAQSVTEFDIALVDWNLEDGNGVDVLKKLRSTHPDSALYLMSATRPDQSVQQQLDKIHAFYEAKPLSPIRLKNLIEL